MPRQAAQPAPGPDAAAQTLIEAAWLLICSRVPDAATRTTASMLRFELAMRNADALEIVELSERPALLAMRSAHQRASKEEASVARAAQTLVRGVLSRLPI